MSSAVRPGAVGAEQKRGAPTAQPGAPRALTWERLQAGDAGGRGRQPLSRPDAGRVDQVNGASTGGPWRVLCHARGELPNNQYSSGGPHGWM